MRAFDFNELKEPPTLDDILVALKKNTFVASDGVLEAMKYIFESSKSLGIEQFNFGELAFSAIKAAEREAFDFIEHGHFTMPYPVCFYRTRIRYDLEREDQKLLGGNIVGSSILTTMAPANEHGMAAVLFLHSRDRMIAIHSINRLTVTRALHVYQSVQDIDPKDPRAIQLELPPGEHKFWASRVRTNGGLPTVSDLSEGSMMAMGLTMILGTKGVSKQRVEPPAKPNAARIKAGKLPLPYVTYVRTDLYNRAAAPGTGTHASPRPHIRRAHIRHYAPTEFRPAFTKPIAAMLVNWDGQPLDERKEYRVVVPK
jgi:hypothetical protein